MTNMQFISLLKTVFKDHLNAHKSGKTPSFQQLDELVEMFREQVIDEFIEEKKQLKKYRYDKNRDDKKT